MQRRDFLKHSALLAVTTMAVRDLHAAETPKPNSLSLSSANAQKELPHFAEVATACALKGELCVQYAEERLLASEANFTNCHEASNQMVVLCQTVAKLATLKSARLPQTLQACTDACRACKDACEEHKAHWKHGMHMECKACAEHCDSMLKEIDTLKTALA